MDKDVLWSFCHSHLHFVRMPSSDGEGTVVTSDDIIWSRITRTGCPRLLAMERSWQNVEQTTTDRWKGVVSKLVSWKNRWLHTTDVSTLQNITMGTVSLLKKCFWDQRIKENEMSAICSTHGGEKNCLTGILMRKLWCKMSLRRSRTRWEDNIKLHYKIKVGRSWSELVWLRIGKSFMLF